MTLESKSQQHCPHCNTEQTVQYYQSVNITLEPELKSKILSGTLNTHFCSNCKQEINIVSDFLYHDMEHQIMLELSLEGSVPNLGQEKIIENLLSKGYIYRKVHDYSRLVEKINIFDHQLNDTVVRQIADKMKAMLDESVKTIQKAEESTAFSVIFNKIERGLFKKSIAFNCFSNPSQIMKVKYDFKQLSAEEKKHLYNMDMLRNK